MLHQNYFDRLPAEIAPPFHLPQALLIERTVRLEHIQLETQPVDIAKRLFSLCHLKVSGPMRHDAVTQWVDFGYPQGWAFEEYWSS